MNIEIILSEDTVFEGCLNQTSIDFQSMRVRNTDTANAVYDDWVMTKGIFPVVRPMLSLFVADIAVRLHTIVNGYSTEDKQITLKLTVPDGFKAQSATEQKLLEYLRNRILSWWYQYRDETLSEKYAEKANVAVDGVFNLCIVHSGVIIGRYF